jgi:16S rRNA (uracil1498-N3)-methyltransferase
MQLFFGEKRSETEIFLTSEDSKHACKSLRKRAGDSIFVTDGNGEIFQCTILDDNMNQVIVNIDHVIENPFPKNYNLHIAISPLKNPDRFEWFVEKATEIGIDEITPIICSRTEKGKVNTDRLNRIALSAAKQSVKAKLPRINEPIAFEKFIQNGQSDIQQKFIAWCETEHEKLLFEACKAKTSTLILIGPEGDFTKDEVEKSLQQGFTPISLGRSRFRTETAGMVACHEVFLRNQ